MQDRWRSAVRLVGCLGVLGACSAGPEPVAERPPDIVLITWDTVRADHVGPGPDGRSATPVLDALGQAGRTWTTARTPSPVTLPAHASLLSGRSPPAHGARANFGFTVSEDVPWLAQELAAQGYATIGAVGSVALRPESGMRRGFQAFTGPAPAPWRPGEAVVGAALEAVRAVPPDQPVFLFVHIFDPHRPWVPADVDVAVAPDNLYRASIHTADRATGVLLDGLAAAGRLDDAVVVLTSDHGESLGEHGELTHAFFAYESTLRVPMVMWWGEAAGVSLPRGSVSTAPVSLLDVAPTLRQVAGIGAQAGEGASLLEDPAPRDFLFECLEPVYEYGTAPIFGMVTAAGEAWLDLPRPERFDLSADPGQRRDRFTEGTALPAALQQAERAWPAVPEMPDPAEAAALAALGYLELDVQGDGADPKDRIPLQRFLSVHPPHRSDADALAEATRLRAEFGDQPALLRFMAERLDGLSRGPEALALLAGSEAADALAGEIADRQAALAADRALAGRIRAALAADPAHPSAAYDLAVVLGRLGEVDEARALLRTWLAAHPDDHPARLRAAGLAHAAGDTAAALALVGAAPAPRPARLDCFAGRIDPDAAAKRAHLERCRDGGEPLTESDLRVVLGVPFGAEWVVPAAAEP